MNRLQNNVAWLGAMLQSAAGQPVTLTRGATVLASLTAMPSASIHEVKDGRGALTKVRSSDWIVVAADLAEITIRSGDVFNTEDGTKYEVLPVTGKDCTEPHDPEGQMLIVHTKRTA